MLLNHRASPGWTADGGCPYIDKKPRPEAGTHLQFPNRSSHDFVTRTRDAGGPGFPCPLRCSGFAHPFFVDPIGLAAGQIDGRAARMFRVLRFPGASVRYPLPWLRPPIPVPCWAHILVALSGKGVWMKAGDNNRCRAICFPK